MSPDRRIRRAYFIELDPETGFKLNSTQPPLSADGLTLGDRVSLGISSEGAMAWVCQTPCCCRTAAFASLVEPSPQGGMATENIVSATSTDIAGTVFARDEGTRTTGGLVDF